ncbi:MAG: DUF3617 domain-containing protein [Sphingomonadales bacterium]|nr:DUF3617 domain-containing protein [Sphingomonadales bacterium]MBD3772506.1 DUF3617 domain-containing protein [Paracoccaceae bacterium]
MQKFALILPLACLALGACSKTPDKPQTQAEMASEAKELTKPTPGQYTSKAELIEFDVPGLPPEQADQMKKMFAGMGAQEQSYCLTKEQADEGFEEAVRKMGEADKNMDCKFDRFKVEGSQLDAQMSCDAKGRGKATMTMTGTLESEKQVMEMHVAQESPQIPGGKMNIGMKVTSTRTGECVAAK